MDLTSGLECSCSLFHIVLLTFVELFLAVEAGLGWRRAAFDPQAGRDHHAASAGGTGHVGRSAHGIAAGGGGGGGGRRHHGCGGCGGPGRAVQVGDGDVVGRDGAGKKDGNLMQFEGTELSRVSSEIPHTAENGLIIRNF